MRPTHLLDTQLLRQTQMNSTQQLTSSSHTQEVTKVDDHVTMSIDTAINESGLVQIEG